MNRIERYFQSARGGKKKKKGKMSIGEGGGKGVFIHLVFMEQKKQKLGNGNPAKGSK